MIREYDNEYPDRGYDPNMDRRMIQPAEYAREKYRKAPSQGGYIRPMYPENGMGRRSGRGKIGYLPNNHYPTYPPMPWYASHQGQMPQHRKPVGFNPAMEYGYDEGEHLDEGLALHVMSKLYYTDRHGQPLNVPKWSIEEIEQATRDWEFNPGVTIFDKWVAFNFFYADTCKVLSPREALKVGYHFFFLDEDAPSDKIFRYLEGMGIIED